MSCRKRGGNYAITSFARVVTGVDDLTMSYQFHALQREGKDEGAQPPTREELDRFVDKVSMQVRYEQKLGRSAATERRRERILNDLEAMRSGPLPTGKQFYAMQNLTGAAGAIDWETSKQVALERREARRQARAAKAAAAKAAPVAPAMPAPQPQAVTSGTRPTGTSCGVQTPSGSCGRTVNRGGTCGVRHVQAWDDAAQVWVDASTGEMVDGAPPVDRAAAIAQSEVVVAGGYPAYKVPEVLSHTKLSTFDYCGEAFRLTYLDGVPKERSGEQAVGIAVHNAAEKLMSQEPADRSEVAAEQALEEAFQGEEVRGLDDAGRSQARKAWNDYLAMRDVTSVQVEGCEVAVDGTFAGNRVTGSIDALVRDSDGVLTVEDLKTGKAPRMLNVVNEETGQTASLGYPDPNKLVQLITYAKLAEQQGLGKIDRIRLMHTEGGRAITVDLDSPYGQYAQRYAENYHRVLRSRLERAAQTGEFDCCRTEKQRAKCSQGSKHEPLPEKASPPARPVRTAA